MRKNKIKLLNPLFPIKKLKERGTVSQSHQSMGRPTNRKTMFIWPKGPLSKCKKNRTKM
jgi:hypothetical protein